MTDDELVVFLSDRDAAIMGLENLTADMLDQLPDLKIISRMGVGLDNVDPATLRNRGIRIGWTGGTNRRSVAELMIAFSVCALRHVGPLYAAMRNGERPRHQMGRHLSERVVGLHGCGNVGKDVVRLLQAWDCQILAHDIRDFPGILCRVRGYARVFRRLDRAVRSFIASHSIERYDARTLFSGSSRPDAQ